MVESPLLARLERSLFKTPCQSPHSGSPLPANRVQSGVISSQSVYLTEQKHTLQLVRYWGLCSLVVNLKVGLIESRSAFVLPNSLPHIDNDARN